MLYVKRKCVSDCSGYFFAWQKSLSEKRASAGLPAEVRPQKKSLRTGFLK
jgi:hypothetical protein